jgi:parallel beta-helix repeat protein
MALDKKQGLAFIAVFVLLLSAAAGLSRVNFGSANYVPWVWHNSGIFIRSDGSVDPSTSPIRIEGNVYTLTGDVFAGIAIERNDTTFDGNGYRLFGSYYGTGVLLQNVSNVVVENTNVQYFEHGIYLDNSNSSILKGNTMGACGIEVTQNSNNNQIIMNKVSGDISIDFVKDNEVTGNSASSISLSWSTNVTVLDNNISDDKRIDSTLVLGNYSEGIYADNSGNCRISDNTVERKNIGIDIWQSTNFTLTGNTLLNNQVGFKLLGSDIQHNLHNIDTSNTVNGKPVYFLVNRTNYQFPTNAGWLAAINCKNITVQNLVSTPNWDGVLLVDTQDSKIVNSNLTGNFNAIRLQNVTNCIINQNTITNNEFAALYFEGTTNSTITENEILSNYYFLDMWHNSTNNTLFHNDFIGNWTGSVSSESQNQWDNGVEGNFWSTFAGVDLNHNGISDSPYLINSNSNNSDRYPLMKPRNSQAAEQLQIQTSGNLLLAMPEEYLNYSVSNFDGKLFAIIDGVYPMHLTSGLGDALPMVYPTPPGTVNMHIVLDGTELTWSNYSDIDPAARHQTDIGDWQMIYCTISPASADFLLKIHYEHPIEIINGSYTFLYDLNISPYLSSSSLISTAHFTLQLPTNESNLSVYTTGSKSEWSPLNFSKTKNASGATVTFNIVSEYGKPLLGDVAFILGGSQIPEFSFLSIPVLFAAITSAVIAFHVKGNSRKTANNRVCHGKN